MEERRKKGMRHRAQVGRPTATMDRDPMKKREEEEKKKKEKKQRRIWTL